jgi:membrane-bound metal-dependent hydrolase YbcI (DUF457 family)
VPFTPIHLGPGLVFKAIGGRHFSFMVFGGSQVMIDIEPLLAIIYDWDVLHGRTHTIPGALLIGTLAGIIGRPISATVLRWLQIPHAPFTWTASFVAAYLGTFSHLVLDGIMHSDILPLWPLRNDNPLRDLVSMEHLHLACLAMALAGGAFLAGQAMTQRHRGHREP